MDLSDPDSILPELDRPPAIASDEFARRVLADLGPSRRQLQAMRLAGLASCLAAIAVAAAIARELTSHEAPPAAPEFTLLTRGVGGFAHL